MQVGALWKNVHGCARRISPVSGCRFDYKDRANRKKRGNANAFPLRTWASLLTASELASKNSGDRNAFLLMILGQQRFGAAVREFAAIVIAFYPELRQEVGVTHAVKH